MKISALLDDYVSNAEIIERCCEDPSYKAAAKVKSFLKEELGGEGLHGARQINAADLQAISDGDVQRNPSFYSVLEHDRGMWHLFDYMREKGYRQDNPYKNVRLNPALSRLLQVQHPYTDQSIVNLCHHEKPRSFNSRNSIFQKFLTYAHDRGGMANIDTSALQTWCKQASSNRVSDINTLYKKANEVGYLEGHNPAAELIQQNRNESASKSDSRSGNFVFHHSALSTQQKSLSYPPLLRARGNNNDKPLLRYNPYKRETGTNFPVRADGTNVSVRNRNYTLQSEGMSLPTSVQPPTPIQWHDDFRAFGHMGREVTLEAGNSIGFYRARYGNRESTHIPRGEIDQHDTHISSDLAQYGSHVRVRIAVHRDQRDGQYHISSLSRVRQPPVNQLGP